MLDVKIKLARSKMREKKSMKKISDEPVREFFRKQNRERHHKEVAAALKDDELFTLNQAKDGLAEKRAKLAADRFKRKNTDGILKSKTEVALLKKLEKKNPAEPVKKDPEVFDVWGSSDSGPSKKVQKFKSFTKESMTRINAIVTPFGGQSVNPALNAHREILKRVVTEEEKELEQNYRGSMAHANREAAAALDILEAKKAERQAKKAAGKEKESESEASASEPSDSDSEDSEAEEKGNKPVDRRKKLTKQQRNQKTLKKEKVLAQ